MVRAELIIQSQRGNSVSAYAIRQRADLPGFAGVGPTPTRPDSHFNPGGTIGKEAAAGVGGQPLPIFLATVAGVLPGFAGVAGVGARAGTIIGNLPAGAQSRARARAREQK